MKVLYVVNVVDEKYVDFHAVQVEDENENDFIILDRMNVENYVHTFPKNKIDVELELAYVTDKLDKESLRIQIDRIYNKLNKVYSDQDVIAERYYKSSLDLLKRCITPEEYEKQSSKEIKMERKNKVALITGGSRGIGEAISRKFASQGYNVIINFKQSIEKAKSLKNQLEKEFNVKVMIIQADLSIESEIVGMISKSIEQFGKIDVLVNNAGIVIDKEFEDRTIEDWNNTLKVNLIAPFLLTKIVGKEMMKQKSGAIINISSTNGIDTYYPSSVDYDASKSGLISLTYDSAVQFSPYVRVNCIAPGWVNTEMNKELDEDFVKSETERILVKRFGEPEEIANVVAFLASDEASFINSTIIKVDGGWY